MLPTPRFVLALTNGQRHADQSIPMRPPFALLDLIVAAVELSSSTAGDMDMNEAEQAITPRREFLKTSAAIGGLVAISGNSVLVGAPDSNLNKGAAYLYVKPASGWATTSKFKAKLIASDGAAGDSFGWVAISGGNYVVGAPFHNGSQGSAYVFGP